MAKADLGGRRVLVVEDEPRISMLIRDTLEDLGCKVVLASHLEHARAKAASLQLDVVLLGASLNGQPGYPLAKELAARGVPFVLVTGYGDDRVPDEISGAPVLQKPFLRAELERILAAALDR
jgi:DNA-binding response OmpR family regulator